MTDSPAPLLEIAGLSANVAGKAILNGLDLVLPAGEVHAIMGPNGSGKSTLAYLLAGREGYERTAGSVRFLGRELLDMPPEERAREGVFLGFQYPVEIPGVPTASFLRAAVNAVRRHRAEPELDAAQFLKILKERRKQLNIGDEMLGRALNTGFSGGEKKRAEILQMLMLEPRLAILDETDSGLDIDALKIVADGINALRRPDRGILMITHYRRLLDYVSPDRVHVLSEGRIVRAGGVELAHELEKTGYGAASVAA
jgi:Fe-S cluster assembly ATP-binding protein